MLSLLLSYSAWRRWHVIVARSQSSGCNVSCRSYGAMVHKAKVPRSTCGEPDSRRSPLSLSEASAHLRALTEELRVQSRTPTATTMDRGARHEPVWRAALRVFMCARSAVPAVNTTDDCVIGKGNNDNDTTDVAEYRTVVSMMETVLFACLRSGSMSMHERAPHRVCADVYAVWRALRTKKITPNSSCRTHPSGEPKSSSKGEKLALESTSMCDAPSPFVPLGVHYCYALHLLQHFTEQVALRDGAGRTHSIAQHSATRCPYHLNDAQEKENGALQALDAFFQVLLVDMAETGQTQPYQPHVALLLLAGLHAWRCMGPPPLCSAFVTTLKPNCTSSMTAVPHHASSSELSLPWLRWLCADHNTVAKTTPVSSSATTLAFMNPAHGPDAGRACDTQCTGVNATLVTVQVVQGALRNRSLPPHVHVRVLALALLPLFALPNGALLLPSHVTFLLPTDLSLCVQTVWKRTQDTSSLSHEQAGDADSGAHRHMAHLATAVSNVITHFFDSLLSSADPLSQQGDQRNGALWYSCIDNNVRLAVLRTLTQPCPVHPDNNNDIRQGRTAHSGRRSSQPRRTCLGVLLVQMLLHNLRIVRDSAILSPPPPSTATAGFTDEWVRQSTHTIALLRRLIPALTPNVGRTNHSGRLHATSRAQYDAQQSMWRVVLRAAVDGVFASPSACLTSSQASTINSVATAASHPTARSGDEGNNSSMDAKKDCCVAEATSSSFLPARCSVLHDLILPLYTSSQWRKSTVNMFVMLLDQWNESVTMRDCFVHIQRREMQHQDRLWNWVSATTSRTAPPLTHLRATSDQAERSNEDEDDARMKDTSPGLYAPALSLTTCETILRHCCDELRDPHTSRQVVRYLLLSLHAVQHAQPSRTVLSPMTHTNADGESDQAGLHANVDGQSIAEWIQWVKKECVPRVNELNHEQGTATR